jgi:hypothetical protein
VKWIVMERGFEYNDEYNTETEFGSPYQLIEDKAEAQAEADRLNELKWSDPDSRNYCPDCAYDWESKEPCEHQINFYYIVPVPESRSELRRLAIQNG